MAFERIEADIGYNVMIVFSQRTADAAPIVDWHGSPSDQAGRADVVPIVVGHGMQDIVVGHAIIIVLVRHHGVLEDVVGHGRQGRVAG